MISLTVTKTLMRCLEILRRLRRGFQGETTSGKAGKGSGLRIFLLALAACIIIGIGVWASIPKEVTDIDAGSAEEGAEIYIGESLALECTVKPDWFKDEPVTFASSDEKIFTVSEDGTVKAGDPGQASLTMTAKNYSEEVSINVVPKVTSIKGIEEAISLTTGDTLALEPVLEPEKFAKEPVSYKSGDENVFTVSEDGLISAVSAGEANLTVRSGGCKFKSTVTVSDPVVYYPSTPTKKSSPSSSKKSKKSNKSNKSSKGNKGYFDSGDDEHF